MKLLTTVDQGTGDWARWVNQGDTVYYLQSTYDERMIPKTAGFGWCPTKKVWYTIDRDKAAKLAEYAVSTELRDELTGIKVHQTVSLAASRAASSAMEFPHPEGWDYYPFQKAGIEYSLQRVNTLNCDEMGIGKEQPVSEPILTPSGWNTIGKIRVNDLVVGSDGKPKTVTGVFKQGIKPVYEITFTDQTKTRCGLEHLWNVRDGNTIRRKGKNNWMTLSISQILKKGILLKSGFGKFEIPHLTAPVEYNKFEVLPINPYLMGVIIANGSCCDSSIVVTVSSEDSDVMDRISAGKWEKRSGCCRKTLKGLKSGIRNLGLEVLSANKFIPDMYKYSSIDQRLDLLRGLMDCDGSNVVNRISYHTVSFKLAEDVAELVRSLGGQAIVRSFKRKEYIEYCVNVKSVLCPFGSKRKSHGWKYDKRIIGQKIISAKYIGEEESVCIMIDSTDHLYITNGFKLTHNTIQALGFINCNPSVKTVLVVCPASIKTNWINEAERWLTRSFKMAIGDSKRVPMPEDGYDFVVINYEVLRKLENNKRVTSIKWDLVILDEIHFIRNTRTLGFRSIAGGSKKDDDRVYNKLDAAHIIGLTGTPVCNRPAELWPLISLLDPESWNQKTFWYFHKRYCNVQSNGYGVDFKGHASDEKLEELQVKLRETIMIRRLKKDVLTELPPKVRQVVELEYDEIDSAVVSAIAREKEYTDRTNTEALEVAVEIAKADDDEHAYKVAIERLESENKFRFDEMAAMRKSTAIAKIPYVIKFVEDQLEECGKVVIAAWHHEMIEAIKDHWKDDAVAIYGSTPIDQRQQLVDWFQTDPKCRVAVLGIKAAGVGITLTAASVIDVVELPWTPGDLSQVEDRCIVKDSLVFCLRSGYIKNMSITKIQDIRIGDCVLTHEGRYREVINTYKHEHRGMVTRIEYVGWNEPLACTYDHKIFIKRNNKLEWVRACDALPSDSMAFPKHVFYHTLESVKIKDEWRIYKEVKKETVCSIKGCLKPIEARGMCRIHYREVLNKKERPIAPLHVNGRYVRLPDNIKITEDWLYLFGWFVAEGFSSIIPGKSKFVSFSGHEKEEFILLKIAKTLSSIGIKSTIYKKSKSHGIEMRSYSGELAFWFRDWFGHMAKNKTLPTEIIRLCPEQAVIFLKGYTDGDGYQRGNQVEWVSASPVLCYQICELAIRAGFIPTMRRGSLKSGNHWVGGYTKFGKGDNKRMNDQDRNYIYRPIRRVETKNEKVMVYDLTVEEDHSFTVGFATVHNCHRIGQTDTVNVYHLVLKDSIDVLMAKTLIEKQEVVESTLNTVQNREVKVEKSTRWLKRERIIEEAHGLTTEIVREIHAALKYMSGMDGDYARTLNDIGYNKIDTKIGHELSARESITAKQAVLAKHILRKYKRQIPENIYNKIFA